MLVSHMLLDLQWADLSVFFLCTLQEGCKPFFQTRIQTRLTVPFVTLTQLLKRTLWCYILRPLGLQLVCPSPFSSFWGVHLIHILVAWHGVTDWWVLGDTIQFQSILLPNSPSLSLLRDPHDPLPRVDFLEEGGMEEIPSQNKGKRSLTPDTSIYWRTAFLPLYRSKQVKQCLRTFKSHILFLASITNLSVQDLFRTFDLRAACFHIVFRYSSDTHASV